MSGQVLSLRDLTVEFPGPAGPASVVDRVSLSLERGEALGMVGESGSGKTMIALSLLGLVPEPGRVAGGEIRVNGHDMRELDDQALNAVRGRDVGMVFQNPMSAFNPVRSIGHQLAASVQRHTGADRRQARERAVEALRDVGIPAAEQRVDAYPHQMSGGMLQRAMIALAMINGPALVIADEPTTALDATIQAQILELLRQRLDAAALLLVTHNLAVAATICSRIVVVYAGRVVETGAARRILGQPRHPYTRALLRAAPRIDPARPRLEAIVGQPPGPRDLVAGCRFAPRCPRARAQCTEAPPLTGDSAQAFACWHPLESGA
jgi:oligopeptide/dipeptide ABC transporter ATP-binding protein